MITWYDPKEKMPEVGELKKNLSYNRHTGEFTWISGARKGFIAGALNDFGYRCIQFKNKSYKAHRLAFLLMGRKIPRLVDHVNRITSDNRWCNLRPIDNKGNRLNSKLNKNNKTGYRGVYHAYGCKYVAKYSYNSNGKKVNIHLGTFICPKLAYKAYCKKVKDFNFPKDYDNDQTN